MASEGAGRSTYYSEKRTLHREQQNTHTRRAKKKGRRGEGKRKRGRGQGADEEVEDVVIAIVAEDVVADLVAGVNFALFSCLQGCPASSAEVPPAAKMRRSAA